MYEEHDFEFEFQKELNIKKVSSIFGSDMTPSIIMCNPKYPHNVGGAIRACSCFNAKAVLFTGNRVTLDPPNNKKYRLPREERMRGYKDVIVLNDDYPLNRFENITPVAIEFRQNSEQLTYFEHPKNPVYVFGPEDGSIPTVILQHCHRFVVIPSKHCLNLAAAIYIILYDRILKLATK